MSVTLRAKLESISSNEAVAQLNALLPSAHVSINWGRGQRIVTVDGYEGSVEINEVAAKYLQASPFNTPSSPKERLDCYELWDRVKQLYTDSEEILNQTWVYKYLIPIKETIPLVFLDKYCHSCTKCSMVTITKEDFIAKKESIFKFSLEEFCTRWPGERPGGFITVSINEIISDMYFIATKDQVERVLDPV